MAKDNRAYPSLIGCSAANGELPKLKEEEKKKNSVSSDVMVSPKTLSVFFYHVHTSHVEVLIGEVIDSKLFS